MHSLGESVNRKKRPIGIDVFCGAGGMSLGFEQAGVDVMLGIDYDSIHLETFSVNYPDSETICKDVAKLSGEEIRQSINLNDQRLDVLFGGPPCGGFSLIGRRNKEDPRNELLVEFARLVKELRPKYFVVENVRGIQVGAMRDVIVDFLLSVRMEGYTVVLPIQHLNASEFGVPQMRSRVFILGYEKGLTAPMYPVPALDKAGSNLKPPTVWDAIGDLPGDDEFLELYDTDEYLGTLGPPSDYAKILRGELRESEDLSIERKKSGSGLTGCKRTFHSDETIKRFNSTAQGSYEQISRYYRLKADGLSPTLRSGSDRNHGSYTAPRPIHPINPRCITVREGARLHSIPDWFQLHSTKWHGFRQIGNSVPPALARAVANSIIETLST